MSKRLFEQKMNKNNIKETFNTKLYITLRETK